MLNALKLEPNEKKLLKFIQDNSIPSYRQAYSDRTAWLMACLSELAYQPMGQFDEEGTRKFLQAKLENLLSEGTKAELNELIRAIFEQDNETANQLTIDLEDASIDIVKSYDVDGTQALMLSTDQYLALAFRGTEATSFKDIKTDLKANITICKSGGRVHSGFNEAFNKVLHQIQSDLNNSKDKSKPLIITGHSLGGALATIATKRLNHSGGIAACYTFGSPRVVDEEWSYRVKPPIYRVVNAIDCVTMLPPGGGVIATFKFVLGFIPVIGNHLKKFISNFEGYYHLGDMRYLTNCKPNQYNNVKLINAVSLLRRMRIFAKGTSATKFVKDHSISIYRKKLAIIALKRND